jgi:hypothetical protein
MTVQVYPQPASDPTSNVNGASWVANVYSNIDPAIDVGVVNRTFIPLTTSATVIPGVYEFYQTVTGATAGGWTVMYPDNSTTNIVFASNSATGVVKVNTSGTLYSHVPTSWQFQSSPLTSAGFLGQPHYANGYIAIPGTIGNGSANTPRIRVTTNGDSYTEYNPAIVEGGTSYPTAITYLNNANRWVVCGNSTYITSSTDLINWSTGQNISNTFVSMASNGTNRVSAITNQSPAVLWTSTNGLNWTTRTTGISAQALKINCVNGIWHVLNGNSGFNPQLITSTDGINWNSVTTGTFPVSDYTTDVAFGNGRYVIVSQFGNLNWSTDGFNWSTTANLTRQTDSNTRRFFTAVFNDGRFVVAGNSANATSGRVWTSTDAANWTDITTAATSGTATTGTSIFYSVAVPTTDLGFPNSTWVLFGANDSSTGVWTTKNIVSSQQTQSRKIKGRLTTAMTQTLTRKSGFNLNYTTTVA